MLVCSIMVSRVIEERKRNMAPKKMIPMMILEILSKYTDEEHTLSQRDIIEILQNEYEVTIERKAVSRNLNILMEMGHEIGCSESVRMVKNRKTGEMEESYIQSDFYLVRDFTDAELRLLIDSLLFSKHVPRSQCKRLIEKLEGLSNQYFKAHVKHIHSMPDKLAQNKQLFFTIEMLDEAISKKRKVAFKYLEYRTDKKQHPKERSEGEIREYIVSPYQMAAKEGKYYLICNYDKYDDISNYRVDRISEIRILDEKIKPFKSLEGSQNGNLDLAKYMAEHIYMYSSGNVRARFRIVKPMISDIIDVFGMDVEFSNETDEHVEVTAHVNRMAMKQFAKSYAPDVLVLEPADLAEEIVKEAKRTVKEYGKK